MQPDRILLEKKSGLEIMITVREEKGQEGEREARK
jgi:hypothetical protein